MAVALIVLNIRAALDECDNHIADIRLRNTTLINYYIYPGPVPTAINAYEPRIATLQSRIKSIKRLNFNHLEQIIDDPDCLAATHLLININELLGAVIGFKRLFEEHYDTFLSQRAPYAATYRALEHLQNRLQDLIRSRQSNPNRPRAEQLLAYHHSNSSSSSYRFCPRGIQVLNSSDQGLISAVSERDLLPSNRAILSEKGGAYLWWICPSPICNFKLRFHIIGSQASSIHNNTEMRSHPSVPLEYRSTFLIKSHLHSSSNSAGTMKYGCLLCFAEGKDLQGGLGAWSTGKELATHIFGAHKGGKLPPAMILEKIKIAVGGVCPVGVKRWDANFAMG